MKTYRPILGWGADFLAAQVTDEVRIAAIDTIVQAFRDLRRDVFEAATAKAKASEVTGVGWTDPTTGEFNDGVDAAIETSGDAFKAAVDAAIT